MRKIIFPLFNGAMNEKYVNIINNVHCSDTPNKLTGGK